jgi:hypothetical protein
MWVLNHDKKPLLLRNGSFTLSDAKLHNSPWEAHTWRNDTGSEIKQAVRTVKLVDRYGHFGRTCCCHLQGWSPKSDTQCLYVGIHVQDYTVSQPRKPQSEKSRPWKPVPRHPKITGAPPWSSVLFLINLQFERSEFLSQMTVMWTFTVKIEAVVSTETLVRTYQNTRNYI